MPKQSALPRWRGFNLTELTNRREARDYVEDDYRMLQEWGFDFVRLPLAVPLWTTPEDPYAAREEVLVKVDRGIELARQYGMHACVNFHTAPGYGVNLPVQNPSLWKHSEAEDQFVFHWELFARRYKGLGSDQLSFNLVNEPRKPSEEEMTREDHERVMRRTVQAIRAIDPERLVIVDGLTYGTKPSPELADLGVAQSCRLYAPMGVSHYKASWCPDWESFPEPRWPGAWHYGETWDRQVMEEHFAVWDRLIEMGVGVHCGEGGCFIHTPHEIFLSWFREALEMITARNVGYAVWNFRGAFGVLDSGRADVEYEDFHGHKLDRQFLSLLQEF